MKRLVAITALLALSACAVGDELARDQAKRAVNPVLAAKFPGVPLEPASNCVIDNASGAEILELAEAGVTGPDDSDAALVIEIAARPETLTCFLEEGLPALLAGRL